MQFSHGLVQNWSVPMSMYMYVIISYVCESLFDSCVNPYVCELLSDQTFGKNHEKT